MTTTREPAIPADLRISINRYADAPPGLPDRCITISNSERRAAACPRRYLLGTIEGLSMKREKGAARYGALYHGIKETVHKAWLDDRPPTEDEINGALWRAKEALRQDATEGRLDAMDAIDIERRLRSTIDAWMVTTGGGQPPKSFKLIAYEVSMAMPVRTASGSVYAPAMFIVEEDGYWRLARPGDRARATEVRWPWYFIGRQDMLFQYRATGGLYVADDKTTRSPAELIRRLTNDPQVPSYLALLRHNIAEGHLRSLGVEPGTPVLGFWHRVTSSSGFGEPRPLMGRKVADKGTVVALSTAKNQRICSWDYLAALRSYGFDPKDPEYADFLTHLRRNVDAHVEHHDQCDYPDSELDRFERELHADAQRLSAMWRSAVRARSLASLDRSHPRIPVCQIAGGFCDYVGPCMRDGVEVRADYAVRPGLRFIRTPDGGHPSPDEHETNNNDPEADEDLGW